MGPLVRLVGSGIGLASEAIAARKASKAEKEKAQAQGSSNTSDLPPSPSVTHSREPSPDPPAYSTLDPSSSDYGLVEAHDEDHARELVEKGHAVPHDQAHDGDHSDLEDDDDGLYWDLDEQAAAFEDTPPSEETRPPAYDAEDSSRPKDKEAEPDAHKLVKKFLSAHPPPSQPPPVHPLACPVIIPQRRPHSKGRGFVRAYAPVLEHCDVDQAAFIEFLNVFQKASQASPVFEVVFIGGHLVGYVPTLSAQITSTIVQLLAGAAIITQGRHRINTFLDEINNTFFRPRGLYAMLMTYKPNKHSWSSGPTDITQSITKSADPEGLSHKFTNNLKFSGGKSHTEMEIPEAAPLVFPALDAALSDQSPEGTAKKENAFKKFGKFTSEYMDRRAQAEYNADNPNSSLSVPQDKQFASRYADPTHPANSGSLVSLVTGGRYDPRARRRGRRAGGLIGQARKATGTEKGIRKALRADVLYLMIVNMPTEEEMVEAKKEMERAKEEKKHKNKDKGEVEEQS